MATKGFESVASFSKWLPRQPLIHNPGSRCLPVCDVTAIRLCCAQKSYQYMIIASLALQEKKYFPLLVQRLLCVPSMFSWEERALFSPQVRARSATACCVICCIVFSERPRPLQYPWKKIPLWNHTQRSLPPWIRDGGSLVSVEW